jgi:hypothetical protein
MRYKIMALSIMLAGSMQNACAMQQQQSWGSAQRLPDLVALVQSFSPISYSLHQQGQQVRVVEHNGGNQTIHLAQMECIMDAMLNHQMQQHRQWDQIMTDVNETLTQQAVEIGELKAKVAALEQKRANDGD